MATSNPAPKSYTDSIAVFSSGFNSGIAPLLLKKDQVSNGANFSIRGGFLRTRPPIEKLTLVYPSPLLQALVEKGNFQGGGYYRPDYGMESLIAVISGHIIQFTPSGGIWTVSDISIPGDLMSATAYQVWMWQSEKWMIIQDGSGALPVFFDGVSCRRSYGPSQLLATGTAFLPVAPPPIGQSVKVTLASTYSGPFNVPVIFNGEFYQIKAVQTGYQVTLTNLTDTPGNTVNSGSSLTVLGNLIGLIDSRVRYQNGLIEAPGQWASFFTFLVPPNTAPLIPSKRDASTGYVRVYYSQVSIQYVNGPTWYSVQEGSQLVFADPGGSVDPTGNNYHGIPITIAGGPPNFVLGNTVANFTVPAINSTVVANIDQAFTGVDGTIVQIGSAFYSISKVVTSSSIVYLENLSDTSTANYVNPSDILSVPEIQAGRMGAYGMSRNWYCGTDGITYFATDQVGDPSGTPANNYRDSVLKETENTFQANGGSFRLPGTGDIITAMVFPPIMDTALGQGQLQIFTAFSAFSNNSPVDRSTWAALTSPLQTESLKGSGALAQNSTILVNSDVFFRSSFGIGSFVQARRDFGNNSWGNKPISNELQVILQPDNKALLSFGSATSFDNRFISTCAPNVSGQGVFHIGMAVLNNDLISSLRTDLPPAWEGLWTGINALQLIEGRVNGSDRCFAFTFNITDQKIELHELISEADAKSSGQYKDDGVTDIVWGFESPMLFSSDIKPLGHFVRLSNGEVSLTDIKDKVTVKVSYRPLNYPCWLDYHTFTVCADVAATNSQAQYLYRVGLGEPSSKDVDPINDMPFREGPAFQFMFEITGSCTFQGAKFEAVEVPMQKFAKVLDEVTTCQASVCTPKNWLTSFSAQGLPPQPLPPVPPPDWKYSNAQIVHPYCDGVDVQFTGTLPSWLSIDGANLVVAAGAFKGVTQIQADANAQAALNSFVATNAGNGNLACPSLDWSKLSWNSPGVCFGYNLVQIGAGNSSFTPVTALSQTFTAFADEPDKMTDIASAQNGASLTYKGPAQNCNLHLVLSKIGSTPSDFANGVQIEIDIMDAFCGTISSPLVLNLDPNTYFTGAFDFPFTIPDTGGNTINLLVWVVGGMATGGGVPIHLQNQFVGTFSNV